MVTVEDIVDGNVLRIGPEKTGYSDYRIQQEGDKFKLVSIAFPDEYSLLKSVEYVVAAANMMGFYLVKESSDVDQG